MNTEAEIESLKKVIKEQDHQLRVKSVSNEIAIEYARFLVMCDRQNLPLITLEDYIKECCK